jgi:hypothetical protein
VLGFGTGVSTASTASVAAREAARQAAAAVNASPKLVLLFASVDYDDLDQARGAVADVIGGVPIVGITSGGAVFATGSEGAPGEKTCERRGISVVVLAGPDIEVDVRSASIADGLLALVTAGEEVRRASEAAEKRGYRHYTCLAFGPGLKVDGDSFVAAVRKGVGERAVVAGGFAGDEFRLEEPKVFAPEGLRDDQAVIVGLFTRGVVGVASRHGHRPIGPTRTITRSDGVEVFEIDGRPAAEVLLEDVRRVRSDIPTDRSQLASYIARYHSIGIVDDGTTSRKRTSGDAPDDVRELVIRSPHALDDDGALRMSAAIGEGTRICVLAASQEDLVGGAIIAANAAAASAETSVAGALVLSCAGRLLAAGDRFAQEPAAVAERIGAPIGGTCVYGEFARNLGESDAFFNMSVVVVVFER